MPSGGQSRGRGKGLALVMAALDYQGDDCLIWPLFRDESGYGTFGYYGKMGRAHRVVCVLAHGAPPTSKHQAAHSCGRGGDGCYNPRHLRWKTNSENQIERRLHGNKSETSSGARTRLTAEQVAYIQATKGIIPTNKLAAEMGFKRGVIRWWRETMRPFTPLLNDKRHVMNRASRAAKKNSYSGEQQS